MIVNFIVESSPADIVNALTNFGLKVEPTALSSMRNMLERIQSKMREPGKTISYPVHWDSEKQRRAFFASNGFGGGIPTKRIGAYIDNWKINSVSNGFKLSNTTKGAPYISGGDLGYMQSGIHKERWNVLTEVADKELESLNGEIYDDLEELENREGLT